MQCSSSSKLTNGAQPNKFVSCFANFANDGQRPQVKRDDKHRFLKIALEIEKFHKKIQKNQEEGEKKQEALALVEDTGKLTRAWRCIKTQCKRFTSWVGTKGDEYVPEVALICRIRQINKATIGMDVSEISHELQDEKLELSSSLRGHISDRISENTKLDFRPGNFSLAAQFVKTVIKIKEIGFSAYCNTPMEPMITKTGVYITCSLNILGCLWKLSELGFCDSRPEFPPLPRPKSPVIQGPD